MKKLVIRGKVVEIRWKERVMVKNGRGHWARRAAACQREKQPYYIELDKRLAQGKTVLGYTLYEAVQHEINHIAQPDLDEDAVVEITEANAQGAIFVAHFMKEGRGC